SASCSSIWASVISIGTRVSVRGGSWSSTSWRTRRIMQGRSRSRTVSRWRTPVISRLPSARSACKAGSRRLGSSGMPSTHSTIAADDRLGRLAQPHIVSQQEPARFEKALDTVALVRVERALQALEGGSLLGGPEGCFDDPLEFSALVHEHGSQGRVVPHASGC